MIASDISSKISMQYASVVDNIILNHVFEHILEPYNFLYFKERIYQIILRLLFLFLIQILSGDLFLRKNGMDGIHPFMYIYTTKNH